MTTYGVTPTGFVIKPLDVITSEIEDSLRTALGQGLNAVAPSVFSQIIGIYAEREFSVWQVMQANYNSLYPGTASGQSLANVGSITGLGPQRPATAGTVVLTVNISPGTLLAGQLVSAGANTAQWITLTNVVNSGGGAANFTVTAQCTTTGPIQAIAGSLTTIVTPQSIWHSVTNLADATEGLAAETDQAYRTRRIAQLSLGGLTTVNALRAQLLNVANVLQAHVFENNTDFVDVNGLTPHSIEAVVQGGLDADIANAIFNGSAPGINTLGSTSNTVTDAQGFTHTVKFQRPTLVPIWVAITVVPGPNYPSDGDLQIAEAISAYGQTYLLGQKVSVYELSGAVLFDTSTGLRRTFVQEITSLFIATTPTPVSAADIDPTAFGLATFSTNQVQVTS